MRTDEFGGTAFLWLALHPLWTGFQYVPGRSRRYIAPARLSRHGKYALQRAYFAHAVDELRNAQADDLEQRRELLFLLEEK